MPFDSGLGDMIRVLALVGVRANEIVDEELTIATDEIVVELADVTPIDTGDLAAAWTAEHNRLDHRAFNTLPYIEFIAPSIDDAGVQRILRETDTRIERRIDAALQR